MASCKERLKRLAVLWFGFCLSDLVNPVNVSRTAEISSICMGIFWNYIFTFLFICISTRIMSLGTHCVNYLLKLSTI
jgi:hypothetical protein